MIDYHNFTNISTPKERRKELYVGDIWINAATCLKCNDYIRSKNKHDFVSCSCGNVSINGGSHNAKTIYKTNNFIRHIEYFDDE